MDKPEHHLFVCGSFRANGTPQGNCAKKESLQLVQHLQSEVDERGLEGVAVAMTGCLNCCVHGPVVIDYPSGNWYKGVTPSVADEILDAIEAGTVATDHLL
ncbi:MAG: (2Fe-2S) ferredoxin domain-containing protein [Opitutaceae bacterium]|nr:(2Fe-2S) ferredoxin domain-containing protein [Opitutaceae bacterium]